MKRIQGVVSRFCDFKKEFVFFVHDSADLIQGHHLNGQLYEIEELRLIREHSVGARVFVDIGANVGNHAIFMAKVLGAQKVYAFEANPSTAEILKLNVLLNNVAHTVDTSHVGMGLGDRIGTFRVEYPQRNNIGAARLVEEEAPGTQAIAEEHAAARVMVCPFDSLSLAEEPQFVKIDVEGMEMSVLRGMAGAIEKFRPPMLIEVDNGNFDLFDEWMGRNDYVEVARFKRYAQNENFLIKHRSAV